MGIFLFGCKIGLSAQMAVVLKIFVKAKEKVKARAIARILCTFVAYFGVVANRSGSCGVLIAPFGKCHTYFTK